MHQTFDRKVPLSEQRLKVALSKCARKQGKKHGTGKRKASQQAARKAATAHKVRVNDERRKMALAAGRAYWRGDADCLMVPA